MCGAGPHNHGPSATPAPARSLSSVGFLLIEPSTGSGLVCAGVISTFEKAVQGWFCFVFSTYVSSPLGK